MELLPNKVDICISFRSLGVYYNDNETIYLANDKAKHVYVIQQGFVDLWDGDIKKHTIGPNEIFGVTAINYNGKRKYTAKANNICRLIVIDKNLLLKRFMQDGSFAFKFLQMTISRYCS